MYVCYESKFLSIVSLCLPLIYFSFKCFSRTKHNTMGTCYSKRSACYDLTQNHHAITMCTLKSPGTPPATLRRFSSLRHSVKSFSSMAYQRRSFRTRPMTGIKQSPKTKHLCIIKYNESKEALV
ncbi:unnamed protein product [Rotaria magnacalcarata]|uniref:Uncharacterized protein n=1 Tax=Rotaria magnacalcarata TaxID=392030 RepID=A0A815RS52_9BILA|nr:unnamed protein product [Rotaria magnacalcarata]